MAFERVNKHWVLVNNLEYSHGKKDMHDIDTHTYTYKRVCLCA